jgi:hypothetical protein
MSVTDHDNPEDRFIEEWRNWARRPPTQSPAEAAATVSRRLPPRRQRRSWWQLAAAAAVITTVALAFHWSALVRQAVPPRPAVKLQEAAPMGKGEVLIWLDGQTPLYMTFQAPENGQGSENKS